MLAMTPWDTFFVVLAVIQVITFGMLIYAGTLLIQTSRKGARRVRPLLRELDGLRQIGQATVTQVAGKSAAMVSRARIVVTRVRQRAETTRRIAREVVPIARESATLARSSQADLARKALVLGDVARRIHRVKRAADSAAAAGANRRNR